MLVVVAVVDAFHGERIDLGDDDRVAGSSRVGRRGLFRTWVLPFEVLSVLLLAALVGAIVLSRRDIGARRAEPSLGRP